MIINNFQASYLLSEKRSKQILEGLRGSEIHGSGHGQPGHVTSQAPFCSGMILSHARFRCSIMLFKHEKKTPDCSLESLFPSLSRIINKFEASGMA